MVPPDTHDSKPKVRLVSGLSSQAFNHQSPVPKDFTTIPNSQRTESRVPIVTFDDDTKLVADPLIFCYPRAWRWRYCAGDIPHVEYPRRTTWMISFLTMNTFSCTIMDLWSCGPSHTTMAEQTLNRDRRNEECFPLDQFPPVTAVASRAFNFSICSRNMLSYTSCLKTLFAIHLASILSNGPFASPDGEPDLFLRHCVTNLGGLEGTRLAHLGVGPGLQEDLDDLRLVLEDHACQRRLTFVVQPVGVCAVFEQQGNEGGVAVVRREHKLSWFERNVRSDRE